MHKNFDHVLSEDERGKDVVINWDFLDNFNTNDTYYVDANGLNMLEKTLWKRKEWKFPETGAEHNIGANFYAVTSGIAIRDKNSQK